MWKCKRCGKCCKFIIIPVMEPVDLETGTYLEAHGIAVVEQKLLIPAVCQYLKKGDLRGKTEEYYCSIHNDKFSNCRLGGKRECEDAQRYYAEIEKARPSL